MEFRDTHSNRSVPSGIYRRSTVGERSAEVHKKLTTSLSTVLKKYIYVKYVFKYIY